MAKSRKNSRYKISPPSKGSAMKKIPKASRGGVVVKPVDAVEVTKAPGVKIVVGRATPRSAVRVSVGIPQYSPVQLLDRYAESADFRKCVDTGKYVFAEGRMVLRSPECIEVIAGRITIKNSIRSKLEDYCVHIERSRKYSSVVTPKKRPGVRYKMHARRGGFTIEIKNAGKFSEVSAQDWTKLIATGGGGNLPYDFGDALKLLMEERNITIEQLAETSGLSEKTISRLRTGENKPSLPTVIAICIGLSLDPFIAEQLVNIAGYSLGGKKTDRAFKLILGVAYSITIFDANDFLRKMGLPILNKSRE